MVGFQLRLLRRCNLCNPPVLPCRGQAKLGEDHPDTLTCRNNLARLLQAQGHLVEAEPLYREALEKCPGAQLQRFQRDFGQLIWSHTLLNFRWLIGFLHDRNWRSNTLGMSLAFFGQKFPKLRSFCFQTKSWQRP